MYMSSTTTEYESSPNLKETARFSRLLRLTPRFELLPHESGSKSAAENMISEGFKRAFLANLESFMPQLLSMHCMSKLSGVAGICLAGNQHLFLEQYLDAPIETEPAKHSNLSVNRHCIAEIGNLVAAKNGASLAVFVVLACALQRAGFTHMVSTATESLREKFQCLGLRTCFIANAQISKLETKNQSNWGTYYQTDPQVIAAELEAANELISQRPLYNCIKNTFANQVDALTEQLLRLRPTA
jgi:hypothetical protein